MTRKMSFMLSSKKDIWVGHEKRRQVAGAWASVDPAWGRRSTRVRDSLRQNESAFFGWLRETISNVSHIIYMS
jgi:hypothetical protein